MHECCEDTTNPTRSYKSSYKTSLALPKVAISRGEPTIHQSWLGMVVWSASSVGPGLKKKPQCGPWKTSYKPRLDSEPASRGIHAKIFPRHCETGQAADEPEVGQVTISAHILRELDSDSWLLYAGRVAGGVSHHDLINIYPIAGLKFQCQPVRPCWTVAW